MTGFLLVYATGHDEVGRVMVAFAFHKARVKICQRRIQVPNALGENLKLFATASLDEGRHDEMIDDLFASTFADMGHHSTDPRTANGLAKSDVSFLEQRKYLPEMLKLLHGDFIELAQVAEELFVLFQIQGVGCRLTLQMGVVHQHFTQMSTHFGEPRIG